METHTFRLNSGFGRERRLIFQDAPATTPEAAANTQKQGNETPVLANAVEAVGVVVDKALAKAEDGAKYLKEKAANATASLSKMLRPVNVAASTTEAPVTSAVTPTEAHAPTKAAETTTTKSIETNNEPKTHGEKLEAAMRKAEEALTKEGGSFTEKLTAMMQWIGSAYQYWQGAFNGTLDDSISTGGLDGPNDTKTGNESKEKSGDAAKEGNDKNERRERLRDELGSPKKENVPETNSSEESVAPESRTERSSETSREKSKEKLTTQELIDKKNENVNENNDQIDKHQELINKLDDQNDANRKELTDLRQKIATTEDTGEKTRLTVEANILEATIKAREQGISDLKKDIDARLKSNEELSKDIVELKEMQEETQKANEKLNEELQKIIIALGKSPDTKPIADILAGAEVEEGPGGEPVILIPDFQTEYLPNGLEATEDDGAITIKNVATGKSIELTRVDGGVTIPFERLGECASLFENSAEDTANRR